MAKYVMSNRRAGKFTDEAKMASRKSLETSFSQISNSVDVFGDKAKGETSRRTIFFMADPSEIESKREAFGPDVIIEPEIVHHKMLDNFSFDLMKAVPLDLVPAFRQEAADQRFLGTQRETVVTVRGNRRLLHGVEVLLFLSGPGGLRERVEQRTNSRGKARFKYASFFEVLGLVASPYGGFWPKMVRGGGSRIDVDCAPLPNDGPSGWWHRIMGILYDPEYGMSSDGTRIGVGVIDSGYGPHPSLNGFNDCGAIIDGTELTDPNDGNDSGSHGTHVCGIIGGRHATDGFGGIAPAADLYSVRVFPANGGANQGDIADAIDLLSNDKSVHLINMSLGALSGSQIERDAIIDALERGTLCICAAANSAGQVEYPVAFPETVAISALGRLGKVPTDSFPAIPSNPDLFGNDQIYAADFTCFGREIICGGGGVGIISTVPERHGYEKPYAAMNGTSMASPAVCAALAILLSKDDAYMSMGMNKARAKYARSLLTAKCKDVGLPREYQGRGVPFKNS
ncbi:MAG: S8 family serine peptidase [Alphaproteobacteria bacterium]|nr:S8 family serine peptidase [Alphaproteobacteria bacterium]